MKYSSSEYAITKQVEQSIRHKVSDLQRCTSTRSAVHVTLVPPYGLKENSYSGIVQATITAEQLFA